MVEIILNIKIPITSKFLTICPRYINAKPLLEIVTDAKYILEQVEISGPTEHLSFLNYRVIKKFCNRSFLKRINPTM